MRTSVDVHNFLQDRNIKHEIFLLPAPARTARRAAALVGLGPDQVAKVTVVLADGEPYCAVIPGDRRLSHGKLRQLVGARHIKPAADDKLVELTDYILGSTPPFAHKIRLKTFVDQRVVGNNIVYTGSGELNSMLKLRAPDLVTVAEAQVADIVKD